MIVIFQILLSLCLAKTWKNTSCLQKKTMKKYEQNFYGTILDSSNLLPIKSLKSDHTWKLLQMFFKLQCDFLPHFWRDFHANLDAYLKKLLKQKKITNLRLSISSIFFRPKSILMMLQLQASKVQWILQKKFWYKIPENTAIRENRNEKLSKF